ncbi:hypothetical protein ES705_28721 [subsurface metagenome]
MLEDIKKFPLNHNKQNEEIKIEKELDTRGLYYRKSGLPAQIYYRVSELSKTLNPGHYFKVITDDNPEGGVEKVLKQWPEKNCAKIIEFRKDGDDLIFIFKKTEDYNSFKVNEFITLEFDDVKEETSIYIAGKLFKQCMGLVVNIPENDVYKFDSIHSIDEIEEYISPDEIEYNYNSSDISPEEEFRAHCSNIAAWAENEYNTEILHRTIAFPLLKQLVKAGDKKAKKIFKGEIADRFTHGNYTVKKYLFNEGYLDFLSREELWSLFPSFGYMLAEIEKELYNEFECGITPPTQKKPRLWIDLHRKDCSKDGIYLGIHYYNHLSKFDWNRLFEKLASIEELEMLDLSYNHFHVIPDSVCKLKNIRKLKLLHNPLKKLPQSIKNLLFLEVLELYYNTDLKNDLETSILLDELKRKKVQISYKKNNYKYNF